MARMEFEFHPLIKWPRAETTSRKRGQFKTPFAGTLKGLAKELAGLESVNPVLITSGHRDQDLRIDGMPRSDARDPAMPGIVVEFYAFPHGAAKAKERFKFACDRYTTWQANLHAIVLTLRALRDVDRHGATGAGEQYAGFRALPGPAAKASIPVPTTVSEAAMFVGQHGEERPVEVARSREAYRQAKFRAVKKFHPDAVPGMMAEWDALQAACRLLDARHAL